MTSRLSRGEILDEVARRGLAPAERAERAIRATLGALGARLTSDEREALARALPEELVRALASRPRRTDLDTAAFYERARKTEATTVPLAHEHVDIVLGALGDLLDDELRRRIARALPREAAERLRGREGRAGGEIAPYPSARRGPPLHTLATARPGSRHPLNEAEPTRAHEHSVARNPAPHAETKLSSARGLTQERHGETLATGRPPEPDRPLHDADED